MTITVTDPAPEVEQVDVDALRKQTILHLLALAEEHNLPWFRQVYCQRFMAFDGECCALDLELDDDSAEAQAAWADVLGLKQKPDQGLPRSGASEPYIWRKAEAHGALPGWWSVSVDTHLYIARGLPEQGPRPTDAELIVAAVLTPDAPELPAEEPAATAEQAEDRRAELQAAIEALDIHEFVSTHVVEGAATGAWWVEVRDADDTQILRLAVHDSTWLVGDEVVGSLTDASPSTVAMFVTGWLESAARVDHLPAEEPAEDLAKVERDWFFTFGADHTHPVTGESMGNSYVQLHGTCDSTRAQMLAVFGKGWSMQYAAADLEPGQPVPVGGAAGVKRFGLTRIELPEAGA